MKTLDRIISFVRHTYYLLVVSILLPFHVAAAPDGELRVLFIGNSYTYFNSAPEQLADIIHKNNPNIDVKVKLISRGGATLKSLWQQQSTIKEIKSAKWDYVVLQEQSMLGSMIAFDGGRQRHIHSPDTFFSYAGKFVEVIKATGAKPLFFMTWARENSPEQQALLTYSYTSMALSTNSLIAPVGLVWSHLQRNGFEETLYFRDGSHPSPIGSYVVAATIYETIFKSPPNDFSGEVSGKRLSASGAISSESKEILANVTLAQSKKISSAINIVRTQIVKEATQIVKQQPKATYSLPTIEANENLSYETLKGDWFGLTTYGLDSAGFKMSVNKEDGHLKVNIELYGPDGIVKMEATEADLNDNKLSFVYVDRRKNRWNYEFAYDDSKLNGQAFAVINNNHLYDNWSASRSILQNNVDLTRLYKFLAKGRPSMQSATYVTETLKYYEDYSQIIGRQYQPYEAILSRQATRLASQGQKTEALKYMKLAVAFYPLSTSALDNLVDMLIDEGKLDKAIETYQNAYNLAVQSKSEDVQQIKEKYMTLRSSAL